MPNYYDELEIEDFVWDPVAKVFHYPCPCGDRFEISKGQLRDGEEIAICPSCSLIVRVIYDYLDWEDYVTSDEEEDDEGDDVDTPETEQGEGTGEDVKREGDHGDQEQRDEGEQDKPREEDTERKDKDGSAEGGERRHDQRTTAVQDDNKEAADREGSRKAADLAVDVQKLSLSKDATVT
ncbi:diphthamide biosynthesis protein 3 [Kwoniella sp. CBS 6097]